MITITSDAPGLFKGQQYIVTEEHKAALDHIAKALVKKPKQVETLVRKSNIVQLSAYPSRKELLNGLMLTLSNSKTALQEFSGSYSNVVDPYTAATESIVSGLGNILQVFNKPSTSQIAQQTNAQILMLAAQKDAASRRNTQIAIAVLLILSAVATVYVVKYYKKKHHN